MSLYDRDYMKDARPPLSPPDAPSADRDRPAENIPLLTRIRFAIWLLLHPRRKPRPPSPPT